MEDQAEIVDVVVGDVVFEVLLAQHGRRLGVADFHTAAAQVEEFAREYLVTLRAAAEVDGVAARVRDDAVIDGDSTAPIASNAVGANMAACVSA